MSSESSFGYSLKYNTHFIVRNITNPKKTVNIFLAPINYGGTRDLLALRGIQETDIRSSLLKGTLRLKLLCGDIEIVSSNINLLQFDDDQRQFLKSYGVTTGTEAANSALHLPFAIKQAISLNGSQDGVNDTFTLSDKFLHGDLDSNTFEISITHNGRVLYVNKDFIISESQGIGTGYDTVKFISLIPDASSFLLCNYLIKT